MGLESTPRHHFEVEDIPAAALRDTRQLLLSSQRAPSPSTRNIKVLKCPSYVYTTATMDFSTILNDGSGPAGAAGAPAAANPPPPPPARPASQYQHQQQYHQQPPQQQALPSTPIQTVPPHSFNDHPQSIQPSPARSMSRDYHPSQGPPFGSPPPHSASNPYATSRPQPPALPHLASNHDMRSPSAGPPVAHSPYTRTTPAASARADYPFPSPGHPPHPDSTASPIQQHRYPPSGGYPPRDSYSQPSGPMASPGPAVHTTAGYFSGQPMPQTPPVGTPGGAHSYLTHQHQRSASAQSHHSYPPNQPYASPIVTNHPPPPSDHMRQPSQPPTPHGPPLSAATRQASGAGTFAQPPSPFQPRGSSSGAPHPPYPPHHPVQHPPPPPPPHLQQQQQQQLHQQPSPHVTPRLQPSPHPSTQRAPSGYEQPQIHPHAVDPHRTSLSQSERERSVSVSPKTRVPSLPSSAGHHSQASFSGPSGQPAELDSRDPRQLAPNNAHMRDAPVKLEREAPHASAPRAERASTPAKRKMDDRDIKLEDLDRQEPRPPPFQSNGEPRPGTSSRPPAVHHSDSPMPPRRRRRHAAPPSWAQPYERQQLRNPNYQLRKHAGGHTHVNGAAESNSGARQERQERATSRHVSPEASRANPPGPPPTQSAPGPAIASMPQLLGPWETTIDNKEPFDEMCKVVADFLLFNVVIPPELADVHGRPGYQFEVEAKLGELRNGREPGRIQLPVLTEVVLDDARSSFAFSSNMSEVSPNRGYEPKQYPWML